MSESDRNSDSLDSSSDDEKELNESSEAITMAAQAMLKDITGRELDEKIPLLVKFLHDAVKFGSNPKVLHAARAHLDMTSDWTDAMQSWTDERIHTFRGWLLEEARSEDHFALELAKLIHGMAAMSAARGDNWPQLTEFMLDGPSFHSGTSEGRLCLYLLGLNCSGWMSADVYASLLGAHLAHTHAPHRAAAIKTLKRLLGIANLSDLLHSLIPGIIERCECPTSSSDEMEALFDLLQERAKLATPLPEETISQAGNCCLKILLDDAKSEAARFAALHIVKAHCQSHAAYIGPDLFKYTLSSILSIAAAELEEETSLAYLADEFFDEFWRDDDVRAMYTPLLLEVARQFVQDADWKRRHAGLKAVALVADGCLPEVVPTLVGLAMDSIAHLNEKVRHSSFAVLASLLQPPHSLLATAELGKVMTAFVSSLADEHWGSVAGVLCEIIEDTEGQGVFLPHIDLDTVLQGVLGILNEPRAEFYDDDSFDVNNLKTLVIGSYEKRNKIPKRFRHVAEQLKPIVEKDYFYYNNRNVQAMKCVVMCIATLPDLSNIRRTMLALLYALAGSAVNEGYNYGQLIVALAEVWRSFDDEPFLAIVLKGLRGALLLGRTDSDEVSGSDIDTPLIVAQKLKEILDTGLAVSFAPHAQEWSVLMVQLCDQAVDEATTVATLDTFPLILESIKGQGTDAVMCMWREQSKAVEKAVADGVPGAERVQRRLNAVIDEAEATIGG